MFGEMIIILVPYFVSSTSLAAVVMAGGMGVTTAVTAGPPLSEPEPALVLCDKGRGELKLNPFPIVRPSYATVILNATIYLERSEPKPPKTPIAGAVPFVKDISGELVLTLRAGPKSEGFEKWDNHAAAATAPKVTIPLNGISTVSHDTTGWLKAYVSLRGYGKLDGDAWKAVPGRYRFYIENLAFTAPEFGTCVATTLSPVGEFAVLPDDTDQVGPESSTLVRLIQKVLPPLGLLYLVVGSAIVLYRAKRSGSRGQ